MFNNPNAIQCMGTLMSKQGIDLNTILELVEILKTNYFQCQRVITILSEVFDREKSGKILHAVNVLEYLVKNGNKNFHQAANKPGFQKRLMNLLRRTRGKSNPLKDFRSNTDNWNKIEAKTLYLIQLWYDAFMLEEAVYNNIVETYKTLRKQDVLFPPRLPNEKNLLFVKTQSPIFQNIVDIARQDQQKFSKKLNSMGMTKQKAQIDMIQAEIEPQKKQAIQRKIDLDEISEKIAVVRSNGCQGRDMLKLIQEIKKDLEHGKVNKNEQSYWKDIKQAGESVIQEWEDTNAELIRQYQREYLESKLGKMSMKEVKKEDENVPEMRKVQSQVVHTDLLMDDEPQVEVKEEVRKTEEVNLLDW